MVSVACFVFVGCESKNQIVISRENSENRDYQKRSFI